MGWEGEEVQLKGRHPNWINYYLYLFFVRPPNPSWKRARQAAVKAEPRLIGDEARGLPPCPHLPHQLLRQKVILSRMKESRLPWVTVVIMMAVAAVLICAAEGSLPTADFQHHAVLDQRGAFVMMWTPGDDNIKVEVQVSD